MHFAHVEGATTGSSRCIRCIFRFRMITKRLIRTVDLDCSIVMLSCISHRIKLTSPVIIIGIYRCSLITVHALRIKIIPIIYPVKFIPIIRRLIIICTINFILCKRSRISSTINIFVIQVQRLAILLIKPRRKRHPRFHIRILRHYTAQIIRLKGAARRRVRCPAGIRISFALPTDIINLERFVSQLKAHILVFRVVPSRSKERAQIECRRNGFGVRTVQSAKANFHRKAER